jgi:hypothetical protein
MKFTEVKTLEHLLKEYGTVGGGGHGSMAKSNAKVKTGTSVANKDASVNSPTTTGNRPPKEPMVEPVPAKNIKVDPKNQQPMMVSMQGKKEPYEVVSPVDDGENPEALVVKDKTGKFIAIAKDEEVIEIPEGKLSKLASRKGKKLKIKDLRSRIKKLSRKRLKEQPEELFEINFNKKEIAVQALDAPVKCGFEAETFFYSVEGGSSNDVDEMSVSDIEYEYGDLPDQVWEDFEDWLYTKGQEEYLDDIIEDKVNEVREDEDYLNDFIDSGDGPSSEAIERYKKDFEEEDPKEYENREEDGWDYMNWVREYVEEEYEEAYLEWLRMDVQEDNDLDDEAKEAARSDYSTEDWIYDNYSYMSSFLDDYGYEYGSGNGDVEGVADELMVWIRDNSEFKDYPESGDYGDTYTTTSWAVEKDSSIEPDEGTGAELISPVFSSPRQMLTEMRSLFNWSETNFGTNNSTGLHITMSWQGKGKEQNKLKMALLLGDEYLLAEFGRLRNSYTKSQYQNVLKTAEKMKRGDKKSFKDFEKILTTGIDTGKFNSIHFKGETDGDSGNNLVEFRIAGGVDYNTMYEKVVKACVRYATIMKAGYDEDAFRPEYVKAVFRLLRKSQEIDPKKLKDLEVVNHEVIDSAKGIVGKKDYFDVIKLLSSSVEYLQNYEKLSSPDADKIWKQEIKDFEKGTGSKVEIEEETIKGYVQPNSMSPSKRAAGELDKAQDRFGSAITLLARDIADGNNRAPVSAKNIGAFRKFAKELQLNTDSIEKLALVGMKNYNFDGTDKEKVARLEKGINSLFKQDIVKKPEFLAIKDVDAIGSKMWQFYQSDDSKDNLKLDKLADLMISLNPSNSKTDVEDILRELSQQRTENGFFAKLKGGGWNTNVSLLKNNGITTKGSAQKLLKFLEPYSDYKHPTSRDHHVNIRSDDRYTEVFQMRLTQRLRARLDHLKDLEREDKEKYVTIAKQVSKMGMELLGALKPNEDISDPYDGQQYLASHGNLETWNNVMDRLVKADEEIGSDEPTFVFPNIVDDYVLASINLDNYYREKELGTTTPPILKSLVKERFAAIKKFLSGFDKIFQKEGFVNLKQEIQAKNTLDRRNKDFEKNVRDNAKAKLNIPSHSWVYIDKEFFDTITDEDYGDREAFLDSNLDHFNKNLNNTKVYVIPSSHWSDAEDATNGLELIDTFEKNKNYYHTWRKKGYKRILDRFNRIYGYSWKDLIDQDKFIQGDGDVYQKLQNIGIEISHKGDSRKGAPGQDDLFPDEETKNPKSGEPLNRSYGISWENMDDEAEQKRFDAFDWEHYPAKMKDVVAKEMANNERSFKVALENILKKVLDGKVEINPEDMGKPLDKLAIAAGIEPDDGGSSNGIAGETDWGNLADYLGIERGVNDQGINLLRKVYQQYDGDPMWRAGTDSEGNNLVGLARWGAAVRDAEKYIRNNYKVSAGNYFRKNADGGKGDDVSGVYGSSDSTNTDYDKAREHRLFNIMMQQGIQNYLPRGEVNKLVAFLNNPQQDNNFKKEVLSILRLNGPFDTFMGAVNAARFPLSQESIFTKFDKLPLVEQLRIVEQSEVLENLSKRSEGPSSDALPDNSIPYLLNKLLSEPMEAGDLRKQMDAFWALPIPQMLSDFRAVRGKSGDKADLRSILRSYASSQLHPEVKKDVKLVENKDEVIQKIEDLPDDDSQTDRIVQYIDGLLDDMGVGGRLKSIMLKLDDIDDAEVRRNQLKIAKMIASLEMTNLERAQLLAKWKKDQLVDTTKLLSGGKYDFSEVFIGYGKEDYITEFIDDLSDVIGQGIGAGEFLLATLSSKITGIGSGKGKGDLLIDGSHIELKTKTAKDARFKDYHVQPDATWSGKVEGFKLDFADIEEVANMPTTGLNSAMHIKMLQNPKLATDPARKKKALRSTAGIIQATNTALDKKRIGHLLKLLQAGNDVEFRQVYGKYNILNYLNIKRSEGDLEGIIFMDKQTKTINYVRTEQEVQDLNLNVNTVYLVSKNNIYPYPQIGVRS